jgi:hypothetical protein
MEFPFQAVQGSTSKVPVVSLSLRKLSEAVKFLSGNSQGSILLNLGIRCDKKVWSKKKNSKKGIIGIQGAERRIKTGYSWFNGI